MTTSGPTAYAPIPVSVTRSAFAMTATGTDSITRVTWAEGPGSTVRARAAANTASISRKRSPEHSSATIRVSPGTRTNIPSCAAGTPKALRMKAEHAATKC